MTCSVTFVLAGVSLLYLCVYFVCVFLIFCFFSFQFLTCVSHTAHVLDIGWTSVRLSVTRWYCVETAQPIVKLSSLPGSPMILVL